MQFQRNVIRFAAIHFAASLCLAYFLDKSFDGWFHSETQHPLIAIGSIVASFAALVLFFPIGYAAMLVSAELSWIAGVFVVMLNSLTWAWVYVRVCRNLTAAKLEQR